MWADLGSFECHPGNWKIPAVPPQPGLRNELIMEAENFGVQVLHDRLSASDAVAAQRIHPNNVRRVIRALEVIHVTGRPFSTQQKRGNNRETLFQIGLTLPRLSLYERADRRLQDMLEMVLSERSINYLNSGIHVNCLRSALWAIERWLISWKVIIILTKQCRRPLKQHIDSYVDRIVGFGTALIQRFGWIGQFLNRS